MALKHLVHKGWFVRLQIIYGETNDDAADATNGL